MRSHLAELGKLRPHSLGESTHLIPAPRREEVPHVIDPVQAEDEEKRNTALAPSEHVLLKVADGGVGFEESELGREKRVAQDVVSMA